MTVRKILSVDDEEEIEFLMKQYFRRKIRSGEYEFFFASTGVEGLAVLNDHPDIDIILCDINMPEMDGLTMLSKVNEMQNPAQRVIMVSAYGDLENIRLAMNDGAFDFATKPIDMDDLARTIEKAIRQIDFVHESQKEHKKLEGLEKDLAAANQIQQFILPRVFPPFPEDSDKLDICASMEAAKDVGGDFYDFFRIDDDRIALVIADVCGKGILSVRRAYNLIVRECVWQSRTTCWLPTRLTTCSSLFSMLSTIPRRVSSPIVTQGISRLMYCGLTAQPKNCPFQRTWS